MRFVDDFCEFDIFFTRTKNETKPSSRSPRAAGVDSFVSFFVRVKNISNSQIVYKPHVICDQFYFDPSSNLCAEVPSKRLNFFLLSL